MRGLVRAFAGIWLACQVVAIVSPIALSNDRFGLDPVACCDDLAPGAVCPMHHGAAGDRTCRMERTCAHHDAILLTIVPVGTLPPTAVTARTSFLATRTINRFSPSAPSRAVRPEAPPPRG